MDQEMKSNNKIEQINIKVPKELKVQSQALFSKLGLTMSSAIVIYLRQCIINQKIPFDIALPNAVLPSNTPDFNPEDFNNLIPAQTIVHNIGS